MNLTVECNKHSIGLSAKIVIDENGKDVTIKVEPCPQCEEDAHDVGYERGRDSMRSELLAVKTGF